MVVKISGTRMRLWRAVDDEGEVLDVLVQKHRNTRLRCVCSGSC
jgi:transposase-like protein